MSEFEEVAFQNGTVRLHAVAAGPQDGRVVVLLHGFPEFWYGWRKQIASLAAEGYRVIAPDQRGYNLSSKPKGVEPYAITHLVADVIAIADELGAAKIFLAGHDWGAAVAWSVAAMHPDRVERLVILNVPHPATMAHFLKTNWRQLLHSWYIVYFQVPAVPEAAFSAFHFKAGRQALTGSSRPGTFSEWELEKYCEAWAQPGAVTAMINWYRAAARAIVGRRMPPSAITVPVRILWGEKDAFLITAMAQDSLRYCEHGELITFPDCTHWLHHEEPAQVIRLMLEFFRT